MARRRRRGEVEPGGAVKTRELTLPGFRHDVGAMNLSMFAGSPFFPRTRTPCSRTGSPSRRRRIVSPACSATGPISASAKTLEETVARIAALSPTDAAGVAGVLGALRRDAPHIFALLGAPMPSMGRAKAVWKAWRQTASAWLSNAEVAGRQPPRLSRRPFRAPKVKAMMAAWGLHLDFAPDIAGGALFPYLESMANQSFGMVIGQGGADTIIKAMVGALKAKGGELLLGARGRARSTIDDGARAGVTLAERASARGGAAVIANAHPKLVFGQLVAAAPAPSVFDRAALAEFRAGPGTMMIHLALDDLPDWRAGEALRRFAYVHIAPISK